MVLDEDTKAWLALSEEERAEAEAKSEAHYAELFARMDKERADGDAFLAESKQRREDIMLDLSKKAKLMQETLIGLYHMTR